LRLHGETERQRDNDGEKDPADKGSLDTDARSATVANW
jgi:hypothetical protein